MVVGSRTHATELAAQFHDDVFDAQFGFFAHALLSFAYVTEISEIEGLYR